MSMTLLGCQKCQQPREIGLEYQSDRSQPNQLICDYCYFENNLDYLADTINDLLQSTTNSYRILKLFVYYDQKIEQLTSCFLKKTHREIYQQLIESQTKQSESESEAETEPVYRYSCQECKYNTNVTANYRKHVTSKKHIKNTTIKSNESANQTEMLPEYESLTITEQEYISSDEDSQFEVESFIEEPISGETKPDSELFSHDSELSAILQSSEDETTEIKPSKPPKSDKIPEIDTHQQLTSIIKSECRPPKPRFRVNETDPPIIPMPEIQSNDNLPLQLIQQYPTQKIADFSIDDTLEFLNHKGRGFSKPRYISLRPDEKHMVDRLLASLLFHATTPNQFKQIYQYIIKPGQTNPIRDRLGQLFYELDQALTKQPKSKWQMIQPVVRRFTTYYLIDGQPKKRQVRRR